MTETGKDFIAFVFNAPVVLSIFQTLYIQECGKELGSLGCHCRDEVLFGSLQVFKSNLFGLCPTNLRPSDLVLS